MLVLAAGWLLWPRWRTGLSDNDTRAVVVPVLVLFGVAVAMYLGLGSYRIPAEAMQSANTAPSVLDMVARLEQRLESEPNDADGWAMLGRSYVVLGRYGEAVDAYAKAREHKPDDLELTIAYAEALALTDPNAIKGEAGQLFEQVLVQNPEHQKGLYYGGVAAWERGDLALAASRWEQLLRFAPPEEVRTILEIRIAEAHRLVGEPASTEPAAAQPVATAETPSSTLSVRVSIAPELATDIPDEATVFLFARGASAGPPLAVVRRTAGELPTVVELSDADAMIPGVKLSDHVTINLVARVALGGSPQAQPGDLYGEIEGVETGADTRDLEISIDRIVE